MTSRMHWVVMQIPMKTQWLVYQPRATYCMAQKETFIIDQHTTGYNIAQILIGKIQKVQSKKARKYVYDYKSSI